MRINTYIRGKAMARKVPDMYLISRAAEILEMHPQTLRKYERLGLVRPHRTLGSMRVYTEEEMVRLRLIKTLVDDAGINLAGVQRLLAITEVAQRMRPLVRRRSQRDTEGVAQLERAVLDLLRLLGLDPASDVDR
jgi:MerR family transcriptional regulator, heat shock protein HspR